MSIPEKPYDLAVRAVVVDEQGRCLLLRRSSACRSFAGTWEWPGGKADLGETLDQAVKREVREETGLEVALGSVAGAYGFEMANRRIAMLCLEAAVTGGTLRLSEEHDDHAWVPLTEMAKWNMTAGLKEFAIAYAAGKLRSNSGW